jgi:prepilin peptidase CpaA
LNVSLNLTLFVLISVAGFFDVKERRIPNWLVFSGMLAGIITGSLQGAEQFTSSVLGLFTGIIALLIPFALRWMGAGDVKLFAAIGAVLGYDTLPRVLFYSCITAGIIALFAVAMGYAKQVSLKNFWTDCRFAILAAVARIPGAIPKPPAYSVPWGVAIGAGTIMAYYLDPTGKWAGF